MAQSESRADIDVMSDINNLIVQYPPLNQDRKQVDFYIHNGVVTVSGHVRSPITRRYIIERLPNIDGVRGVTSERLYDDESIQRDVGQHLGARDITSVIANVYYGIVILTGSLPDGVSVQDLASDIARITGVTEVAAKL